MFEEDFFMKFKERFSERTSGIEPLTPRGAVLDEYLKVWNTYSSIGAALDTPVIAVDGSIQSTELKNGLRVEVARAAAHIRNGGRVELLTDVDLDIDYIGGANYLMRTLEMRTMAAAIRAAPARSIAFFDGSLYAPFFQWELKGFREIEKSFKYYAQALEAWMEMMTEAQLKDAILVGVSKDSKSTYIRSRILRSHLEAAFPGFHVRKSRRAINLLDVKEKKQAPKEIQDALNSSLPDEMLYAELAPTPGLTTPLFLASPEVYQSRETEWRETRGRESIREYATRHRDDSTVFDRCLTALDEFHRYPPSTILMWIPTKTSGAMRVDLPGYLFDTKYEHRTMVDDTFGSEEDVLRAKEILSTIYSLYHEPHGFEELWEIDAVAHFKRSIFETYRAYIEDELAKKGINVDPSRRQIRDLLMRGRARPQASEE